MNYLLCRLEQGVAEGSTEIPKGISFLIAYFYVLVCGKRKGW